MVGSMPRNPLVIGCVELVDATPGSRLPILRVGGVYQFYAEDAGAVAAEEEDLRNSYRLSGLF